MRLARLSVLALLAVVACAPVSKLPQIDAEAAKREEEIQRALILESYLSHDARLDTLAYRFFSANADLCAGITGYSLGARFANKFTFGKDFESVAAAEFGLGETATVVSVVPGSAAAAAGLRRGDVVVSMNGWTVPPGAEALARMGEKYDEFTKDGGVVTFVLRDPDGERMVSVVPAPTCDYDHLVVFDDATNAFATGDTLVFNTGMMRFTDTDEELATVFGHEMAHNLMDHVDKQKGNMALGFLVDLLFAGVGVNTQGAFAKMAAGAFSQEFEAEADYVGVYLMARAGYAIDEAPNFWRRMAILHPRGVAARGFGYTHPSTPERFLALEQTVAEIAAKRMAAQPLLPESEIPVHAPEVEKANRVPWR